ncbi:oleosin H1-like [Rhododendron vialii]|uniref:oleosin H1-like n=1 Tax=Rhododendron vialii TaxID=182163 RepID=UPI00265D6525|nr:oleosin H1-like [Rhododendron vialii]
MADRPHPHQLQVHPQQRYEGGFKAGQRGDGGGPSKGKILAVATLLPVGGSLLGLSGLTLAASLLGLAVATPIFLLCSPVLVPAALVAGLVLAGFFTSGLFGLTGLTSLSWVMKYFRQAGPPQLDEAKRRMQDVAVTVGQKTKEVGEAIQQKAKEAGK